MRKIFISQPMRGKTDEQILAERDRAIAAVQEKYGEEAVILDSFFQGAPAEAKPLWYLGEALKVMSEADVAYFCKGWRGARGCIIEHECAVQYGLKVMFDSDYDELVED